MQHTEDDWLNLLGPKVISISLAASQSDAQLDVCHNPSYSHIKDGTKTLSMKHIL
jgi:hypothetical protein